MLGHTIRRACPIIFLALAALWLAGCSSSGTSDFAFGRQKTEPPPEPGKFPAEYKAQVADFMRRNLTNPTKVRDAYIATPVMKPYKGAQFYITCVRFNPRDSRNQYEGSQQRLVVFLSGEINQYLSDDLEMCAGLTYERFSQLENLVP